MSGTRILTENAERDRSSLFSTMLQALTGVAQDAGVQGFLEAMCQGFLNNNDELQWVWYGFQNKGRPLIPTQEFGLVLHPSIPARAGHNSRKKYGRGTRAAGAI